MTEKEVLVSSLHFSGWSWTHCLERSCSTIIKDVDSRTVHERMWPSCFSKPIQGKWWTCPRPYLTILDIFDSTEWQQIHSITMFAKICQRSWFFDVEGHDGQREGQGEAPERIHAGTLIKIDPDPTVVLDARINVQFSLFWGFFEFLFCISFARASVCCIRIASALCHMYSRIALPELQINCSVHGKKDHARNC